jgi:3-hydroxyacyl-CoA dehydrogenase
MELELSPNSGFESPFLIKKIAVLGAGVMGAQIAAHCVNAGIQTLLFDLESKDGRKSGIVDSAIVNLTKLKPSPLATPQTASLITACNYGEHLSKLDDCDLIIEAIAERLDWKEALYQKITPYLKHNAILVSNTSGLSINQLARVLPSELQARFCGMHFFNPPRYMHLAELTPTETTSPDLLNHLETWLTRYLGKGVVRAKDTPDFIANRIGVFSLLVTFHHAKTWNLGLDEVDALTGTLLGRPKSATCRTMDVVGLDTLQHVVHTLAQLLPDDPWHALFHLPDWLIALIKQGHLGQKTGQGLYRKNGRAIEVYDVAKLDYRPANGMVDPEVKAILTSPNPQERMQRLLACKHPQARFLSACFRDLFHYCAFHLQDIAENVRDVDLALRWGFGWQQGPFETWQASGISEWRAFIQEGIADSTALSSAPIPDWMIHLNSFYTEEGAFKPATASFVGRRQLPVYERQFFPDRVLLEKPLQLATLFENEGVRLSSLQDDVAVIEFKSKANTIGQSVIDGFSQALNIVEQRCQGLIIYQPDVSNFSSGADLRGVAALIESGQKNALNQMIHDFQCLLMRIKYSAIPIVAALRGRALGGGCELLMHCDGVVAAFESYPGLVEVGVGLIPAGGGCKEMARRAALKADGRDLTSYIRSYFEQIATAVVASSAPEASQLGYLQARDTWVMHADEVLYTALSKVKSMQAENYQPPVPKCFPVAGRAGHALLQSGLVNWLEGGFISQHDYYLANQLASVLCGGDVDAGTLVDEAWMLRLEKEAFLTLANHPLTQARIRHLLETGKPLRN